MRRTFKSMVSVVLLCVCAAGCFGGAEIIILGAAAGGLGAYAVGRDTIEGDTDTPYNSLWDAALEISRVRGTVKVQDFTRGVIEFESKPSKVWIRFTRLTQTATRMRISARKNHFPNLDLAQDLFVRIMEGAKEYGDDRDYSR